MLHTPLLTKKFLTLIFIAAFVCSSFAYDNELKDILKHAETWAPGQPLPITLTVYRHDGDCMLVDTDTEAVLPEINNLPLLVALIVNAQADNRVSDEALNAALKKFGPNKVFPLINMEITEYPAQTPTDRREKLTERMKMPHVVIDALSISIKDMPYNNALNILQRVETELHGGREWHDVLSEYQQKYEYPASDSAASLTRVGNMGRFVVFPHKLLGKTYTVNTECCIEVRGPRPTRDFANLDYLPKDHGKLILSAQSGQILKLKDKINDELVLYLVRERYK